MNQITTLDPDKMNEIFQDSEGANIENTFDDLSLESEENSTDVDQEEFNDNENSEPVFNAEEFIKSQLPGGKITAEQTEKKPEVKEPPMDAYKWAEKTGRSPEEFFKLNKDWRTESHDEVLKAFIKEKNPMLDEKEVDFLYNRDFAIDEFDEDGSIEKSINKKKELNSAYEYFDKLKADMGLGVKNDAPQIEIPKEYQEAFDSFQQMETARKEQEAKFIDNRTKYLNKVLEFHPTFEKEGISVGFETELNGTKKDVSLKFTPSKEDMKRVLEVQSDTNSVFMQFGEKDENGNFQIKDYDKLFQLAAKIALIDKYEKFIYEQGASDMAESLIKNDLKRPNYQGKTGRMAEPNGFKVNIVKPKSSGSTMNL